MSSWNQTFDLLKGHDCVGCKKCNGKHGDKPHSHDDKRGRMNKGITSWFDAPDTISKSNWEETADLLKGEGGKSDASKGRFNYKTGKYEKAGESISPEQLREDIQKQRAGKGEEGIETGGMSRSTPITKQEAKEEATAYGDPSYPSPQGQTVPITQTPRKDIKEENNKSITSWFGDSDTMRKSNWEETSDLLKGSTGISGTGVGGGY